MQNKYIVVVLVALIGLAGIYYLGVRDFDNEAMVAGVSNFEECAEAGYPVMESYPARCSTPDGRTFTQEVDGWPVVDDDLEPADSEPVDSSGTPPANSNNSVSTNPDEPVFCTMDAFQCPDGLWVGRTGPNCEFVCE